MMRAKRNLKSMKVSDYISIQKNEYSIVQLIPIRANRNNSTEQLAVIVNKMYKQVNQLIKIENKKLIIRQQFKLTFYIHITKETIQFYFLVPNIYLNEFKVKFREIWRNIEINEVDELPININDCSKYQLKYEYNDILSLNIDKRNNELLNANLTIISDLKDKEQVGIIYNFIPTSNRENNYFHKKYKDNIEKFKSGGSLKKNKKFEDYLIIAIKNIIIFIDDVISGLLRADKKNNDIFTFIRKETSSSTNRKGKSDICKTQAIIISKAENKEREKEIITTMANTYKSIEDDNKLVITKVTKNIDIRKPVLNNVEINKTAILECNNFLNMPNLDIIKDFEMIEHNKILEKIAPKSLCNGEIRIGTVKVKENKQDVFYSTDEQIKRLSKVLLGSMGAGKDYYMVNMAKDIIKANRGLIVIDYIDKCQLAENIKNITPKERLIEIDCSNPNTLQSFLYNEVTYKEDDDIYTKMEISMQKAQQFELLLDSINVGSELTPRMLRYLYCSGTVGFYNNVNSSFKDVIDILKSPEKRAEIIMNLDTEGKKILSEEIEDLEELTKIDKKGNIENVDSKIDGILDRIAKLKSASLYTKLAFNKGGESNIDFIKAMNDRKVILIKIPHKSFKTKMLKDLMATFYLSKIWQAKQLSDNSIQTEVFINELHQSYHSQLLLEDILVEHRKYNITFTFAMHYLDQLTKKCKKSIISSGASFLLISGCDPKAFDELEVYFNKDGYTREDIAQLERYNALCLIKNEDENYSSFICKLPS